MYDLISRQAAIYLPVIPKAERDYISFNLDDVYEQGWNECQNYIAQMPSAERPKGRWYMEHHTWFCDQCGKNPTKGMGYVQGTDELFAYCPHCGAKMVGEDGEA